MNSPSVVQTKYPPPHCGGNCLMKQEPINLYGDQRVATISGNGVDVASQRADDLDLMALAHIQSIAGQHPIFAIDVGCGHGGQAARMVNAGAYVIAMDSQDYRAELARTLAREGGQSNRCFFYRADVGSEPQIGNIHVVMCQRMIHYLPCHAALQALNWFHRITLPGGRMFLSASGMDSELADSYHARDVPVESRFAHLSREMAEKHSILHPVCLYRPNELKGLASEAGWEVEKVFVSPFGNVKLVARRP